MTPKEFGRSLAERVWTEYPELVKRPYRFTVDQVRAAYRREGGPNDSRLAASAARYANKRWEELSATEKERP